MNKNQLFQTGLLLLTAASLFGATPAKKPQPKYSSVPFNGIVTPGFPGTDLPLPTPVRELLLTWRCESPYRLPDDWVFASPANNGKLPFYRGQLLKDHIQPMVAKAGMGKVGWHTFRHSYVAWGKAAGLEAIEMQRLSRHQSLQAMANIYGETAVEAKRNANQRIIEYVTSEAEAAKKGIRGRVQ